MGSRTILSPASVCITDKCSSGVPRLIEDLARLAEDRETCDILFVAGFEEIPLYAHKLILRSRCDSFRDVNGAEICKVPGTMVSPSPMPGPVGPVVVRWPKVKPDILRDVIKYIYTGRIVLLDSCVFEVLVTSKELGIEELRKNCEDHIASSLNVHNACTFLAAALSLESRTRSRDNESNSFVQRCMQFIGDNGPGVL
ncbi:BTB/POZ domain-containing protein 19 [Halotydeus destructor]|nr:BTB/POZ domain-containing protein 19 [Halotydeus destructor]